MRGFIIDALFCISPLDGRYQDKLSDLSLYLSEAGLIYQRARIECFWLQHLHEEKVVDLSPSARKFLASFLLKSWSESRDLFKLVKDIEKQLTMM